MRTKQCVAELENTVTQLQTDVWNLITEVGQLKLEKKTRKKK